MSFAVLGGILLIVGSFFVFKGNIFASVGVYFVADICWVVLAYQHEDYTGMGFIIVGMLLGLGAFLKMNYGTLHKTLYKERK